jgi:hypothetical protein
MRAEAVPCLWLDGCSSERFLVPQGVSTRPSGPRAAVDDYLRPLGIQRRWRLDSRVLPGPLWWE